MNDMHMLASLLAARLDTTTMIFLGVMGTVVASMITYSNWRLGLKIAFITVLVEGAIRKWIIPQAQELAYFTKDVFLIGAYLRFFMFPDPEIRAKKLHLPSGLISLLFVMVGFSTLNPNIGSFILAGYGLKIYFFYLPLVFMVPYVYRSRVELETGLFCYAMIAVPICLLGFAQYAMPGDNILNMQAHGTEGTTMGWEGSRIRITGTFSYISGHATFLILFFALHLALLVNKLTKFRWICLICNLPLLAANALMNGSRVTMYSFAFIGAGFLLFSIFTRIGDGGSVILRVGFLAFLMGIAVKSFFGEARDQYQARMSSAGDTFYFRVVEMPATAVSYAIKQGGLFGYGIGMTHPASEKIRTALRIPKPKKVTPTYDNELGQTLVELGMVGWFAWYALRLLLFFFSAQAFLQSQPGILKSLCVASILIQLPHFFLGMVLNHAANFMVFGFIGLSMIPLLSATVQRSHAPNRDHRTLRGGMPPAAAGPR